MEDNAPETEAGMNKTQNAYITVGGRTCALGNYDLNGFGTWITWGDNAYGNRRMRSGLDA